MATRRDFTLSVGSMDLKCFLNGESKGFSNDDYFWSEEEWQPREEWLKQELEKVNQKLKEYEN